MDCIVIKKLKENLNRIFEFNFSSTNSPNRIPGWWKYLSSMQCNNLWWWWTCVGFVVPRW